MRSSGLPAPLHEATLDESRQDDEAVALISSADESVAVLGSPEAPRNVLHSITEGRPDDSVPASMQDPAAPAPRVLMRRIRPGVFEPVLEGPTGGVLAALDLEVAGAATRAVADSEAIRQEARERLAMFAEDRGCRRGLLT